MYIFARFDVFKLGVSGLEKSAKEDAQTALAIRFVLLLVRDLVPDFREAPLLRDGYFLVWFKLQFQFHAPPQVGC